MKHYVKNTDSINKILKKANDGDTIYLESGIYHEKIKIKKSIHLIGESKESTFITNMDYSTKTHIDHQEYNTFRTYTVMVTADNVKISNLTISNTSIPSNIYGQAVALHVLGDLFEIENCSLQGAQDTLFCGPLPSDLVIRYKDFLELDELSQKTSRQYYYHCHIQGDVDFIFGCGNAIFDHCTIESIESHSTGYVAAPSHSKQMKYGFTFLYCDFIGNAKKESVFLARPWRDYGLCIFFHSNLGPHIKKEGFNKWNDSSRDQTCRFFENYSNTNMDKRIYFTKSLNDNEIKHLTKKEIFQL